MAKPLEYAGMSTKAIHSGNDPDGATGAIIPPIFQTSTYVQESPGKHRGYEYTRSHNPTRTRLEHCLATLEHGQYAVVTASGMAAAHHVHVGEESRVEPGRPLSMTELIDLIEQELHDLGLCEGMLK